MTHQGERRLGVVEAFVAVRDQCPSGAVQRVVRQARGTSVLVVPSDDGD